MSKIMHLTIIRRCHPYSVYWQRLLPLLLLCCWLTGYAPAQSIRYVKQGGTGNGSSWANASGNLQAMINAAGVQQVYVAGGSYQGSFAMKNGVAIYGGFTAANPESTPQQRPWLNPTVGANAVSQPTSTTLLGNGGRVVTNPQGLTSGAILDGFVIKGGQSSFGGGMFNDSSSPSLINCVFANNSAAYGSGAGLFNLNSNPIIVNCVFINNVATFEGGGIFNGTSSPRLVNCLFSGNSSTDSFGGGVYNNSGSNPQLINCTLTGNRAPSTSSAVGGAAMGNSGSNPSLTNCILWDNLESVLSPIQYTSNG